MLIRQLCKIRKSPPVLIPAAVLHSVRTYASAGRFARIRSKAACKQLKFRKCNFGALD